MVEINSVSREEKSKPVGSAGFFICLALSFCASVLMAIAVAQKTEVAGFWKFIWIGLGFLLSFGASFLLSLAGYSIGNWLRKIAMPDAFFSSGMVDTLAKRLFWSIGPQMIGLGIGLATGQYAGWGLVFGQKILETHGG